MAGVGLILTDDDNITGIDLDDCVTDSGSLSDVAAEIIGYGETYAERSPSGNGIRLLALGKIDKSLKGNKEGVEIYGTGRYLTITGTQIEGTPSDIRPAPRTLAKLSAVVEDGRASRSRANGNGQAHSTGRDFFANVNAATLARLDDWVPILHPTARKQPNGAWRVTSRDLGRNLEEDLSYFAEGICDYGEEYGLTPIDAVQRFGAASNATDAALWLCRKLGIEPTSLGWKVSAEDQSTPRSDEQFCGTKAKSGNTQKNNGRRTQAEILIEIATSEEISLYRSPDGTGYADVEVNDHRETWPLKSTGFRRFLRRRYYEKTGGAPNGEAMAGAMGVIEARAAFDGPVRPVHLRVAEIGERIYLDLCDAAHRAVEITSDGWSIIDRPPVRFRRTPGMLAIPEPVSGGHLDELRQHFHMSASDYVLAVSWLLAVLRGRGPYPILALTGEQGTGKSFTGDMLRRLVDPNTAPLRSLPRDTRDLYVAAINGHVLVFDNLSGMPAEISDALCRLSTGGGFSTRALFTDGDEILFDGQRPIALTSINDVANRSDLADRLVIVRLEVIPDEERRPEAELRAAFEAARPRLLGALLDAVSHGLMQLPHTGLIDCRGWPITLFGCEPAKRRFGRRIEPTPWKWFLRLTPLQWRCVVTWATGPSTQQPQPSSSPNLACSSATMSGAVANGPPAQKDSRGSSRGWRLLCVASASQSHTGDRVIQVLD